MQSAAHLANVVTGLAFALAFVLGAVANRVSFCTMGAITDVVNFGDWRRMRMWILAIAVAIAGTALLQVAGLIDTAKTIYTGAKVPWLSEQSFQPASIAIGDLYPITCQYRVRPKCLRLAGEASVRQ